MVYDFKVNKKDDTDYKKIVSTKKVSNADNTGYTEYGLNVNGNPVSKREVSYYDNGRRNPSTVGTLIPGASNPQEPTASTPSLSDVADSVKNLGTSVADLGKNITSDLISAKESYLKDFGDYNSEKPGAVATSFQPSQTYLQAMQYTQGLLDKLSSGRTSYSDKLDDIMAQISGRDKFSYDFNSDPMFLSALQSSMNQGKLAMQDTMGQASALTGGYGSSYGQAVGNQAYNAEIQKAYDNLPEFYGMALDAYNNETQGLLNQLDMYGTADENEYNRLANAYASNAQMAAQLYDQEYNNFWQTQNFNEDSRRWNAEFDYGKQRDNAADELAYAKLLADGSAEADSRVLTAANKRTLLDEYNKTGWKGAESYLNSFNNVSEAEQQELYDYLMTNGLSVADRGLTLAEGTPKYKLGKSYDFSNMKFQDAKGNIYTIADLNDMGMGKNELVEYVLDALFGTTKIDNATASEIKKKLISSLQ